MRAPGAWTCLAASAAFEVVWVVSLKLCAGTARVGPIALYAGSGLGAAFLLALAMRSIPMSVAYTVWMGLSVVGTLALDVLVYREPWSLARAASALMILAGTAGLKLSGAS